MAGFKGFFDWYHENGIIPNVWKGATGQLSQEKINAENIQYQKERNEIEDARYEDETRYNRAFAEDEREYNRAFAQEQQAYNRAFAEDERNYNRAFAAEEQAYNRAFAEDERNYQRDWAFNERKYQRDWALNERDYQRSLQQKIFEREDTAIARQAEALRAQGINPLSQSMNGLGAGSVVSSPSPGSSSPGSSSLPGHSSPGSSSSPGSTSSPSTSAPGLSSRGGQALQKAMITSQGINGLLGPILQTLNTVDSLRGAGIQRDVLNAQAMQAQAEANMSVMEMFDMSNRLNIPEFKFKYGIKGKKQYSTKNNTYDPYYYSPKDINKYEMLPKHLDGLISGNQVNTLDSANDAMSFLTDKLFNFIENKSGLEVNEKFQNSFTSVIENLLLNAFKSKTSNNINNKNYKKNK